MDQGKVVLEEKCTGGPHASVEELLQRQIFPPQVTLAAIKLNVMETIRLHWMKPLIILGSNTSSGCCTEPI